MQTIAEFGAWSWMILAAILFVLEITAPGIFFIWFGLAAVATGLIVFRYDVVWQWQLIWFCLLSVAFVVLAWKYLRKHPLESDRPLLNDRAVRHIGESHDLIDPIVNGRGSVKIGDSVWRVTGPELPSGARVTVVGADGSLLKVVAAGASAAA
jgi:inner membrane protein